MAWYFPPEPFISSEILDIDTINLNLAAVQSEVGGELNEHNFASEALVGGEDNWDDGIGLRISSEPHEVDPLDVAVAETIQLRLSWVPLEGGSHVHVSRGGKALIIASFQISNSPSDLFDNPGLQFALEVDGSVQFGSLYGSGDMTNDYISDAANAIATPILTPGTGPGLRAKYAAVVLETVMYLPAGEHAIRVVARNLRLSSDAQVYQVSSQCEIIVLEGWA